MRELTAEGLEMLATLVRDEMLESFHHGVVAVVDPAGELVYSKGDVEALIYPRSALKPIQAKAMRRAGLKLSGEQLVMSMASHYGNPDQVRLVSEILQAHGLSESSLGCPVSLPWNLDARIGATSKKINMNCSGKHAGFLATCQLNGWDTETYLDKSHPMQQLVIDVLQECSSEPVVRVSTDGCGAPLIAISTVGLARATSQFALTEPELVSAAIDHPELIGDQNTPDAGFLRAGYFSKLGAEGVFTVAAPSGHALAMKVADGSLRLAAGYAALLLNRLGLMSSESAALAMSTDTTEVLGGTSVIGGWEFHF
ncbi:asparaginase [Aquiluna borgnonia]|uniref:Asparaginase n=1 Tax=Aquiluna borgnonia TaxID=2499157 RepID=A0A7D4QM22_9MICO|nr:asparaginase [Aquiluna borgnonia]QKJ24667.1 asparaginase [Aquiluna borgnonia]